MLQEFCETSVTEIESKRLGLRSRFFGQGVSKHALQNLNPYKQPIHFVKKRVSIALQRSKICIVKLDQNIMKHETGLEKNYKNSRLNAETRGLTQR